MLDVRAFEARFALPLTEIGSIVDGPPEVIVHGQPLENLRGHDHLSR